MAPELRTVLRKVDEYLLKKDLVSLSKAVGKAILEFDKDRDYSKSISLLERLTETEELAHHQVIFLEYQSHLLIRYILNNQLNEAKSLKGKFNQNIKLPLASLTMDLLEYLESNISSEYVIQSIERKSLFGNYESLSQYPSIPFKSEDDAVRIMEDYFPTGKYIVNLIQNESQLLHSIKVDVGSSQEVNVLENRRVFRIK